MKILLASSSSGSRGGGEIFLRELAHAFHHHGHEVHFWCSSHSRMDELAGAIAPVAKISRQDYLNTYDRKLRSLAAYADHPTARSVAACWRSLTPDIILINKQNLEDGLDLLRAAREARLPAVAVVHLTQSARELKAIGARFRDGASWHALRDFHGPVVAIEEERGRALADFSRRTLGGFSGLHVIPNGVRDFHRGDDFREESRAALRERLGWPVESKVVLGVGRVMPQKRPELWLSLAAKLTKNFPEHRFVWVGSGEGEAAFDRQTKEFGLEHVLHREAWCEDVAPWLNGADVFLHTAAYEGLPLAILEAMSAELPVLLPDDLAPQLPLLQGAIESFQTDEDLGKLLCSEARLKELANTGRQRYEEAFSLKRCAREYENLFRLVLGECL